MVMISGASSPLYAKRRRRNVITMGLSFAATAFGLSWLVLILACCCGRASAASRWRCSPR